MSITDKFRADVEAYIEKAGMTPTAFGDWAMGDKNFVWDLRNGRSPRAVTMDRVLERIGDTAQ